jgi:hypothetical protein
MDFDLADFKLTATGKKAAVLLSRPENLIRMIAFSLQRHPSGSGGRQGLLLIADSESRTEVKQLPGPWVN